MSLVIDGDPLQVADVLRQLSLIFHTPIYDCNLRLHWVEGVPCTLSFCELCYDFLQPIQADSPGFSDSSTSPDFVDSQ
ncbi:NS7a protein [Wigeon coronavirus HKU20]|uniref:NS7a protein n=1 Tax=Wigeon coronavirus HKU20 TaxID=1159908 RepID=H9BR30_9NIDO|nr:NS7a protein [Wigeon coronavirus HKU20]AFD29239.1 NS7a protein [Wigeon coronavirus HKU20]